VNKGFRAPCRHKPGPARGMFRNVPPEISVTWHCKYLTAPRSRDHGCEAQPGTLTRV